MKHKRAEWQQGRIYSRRGANGDEPPGSVRSEFTDLSIYYPIPSKWHHYNPHTLDNTTDFHSISHKHSDTILEL